MIPAGIKPATFRFVAQHRNHCATVAPLFCIISLFITDSCNRCQSHWPNLSCGFKRLRNLDLEDGVAGALFSMTSKIRRIKRSTDSVLWHSLSQRFWASSLEQRVFLIHVLISPLHPRHVASPSSNLPTLILLIVLFYIYIASLIKCIRPDDGHSNNGRNM